MKVDILHMADLHMNQKDESNIDIVVGALFKDLDKINKEKNLNPGLIFFTGDLISKGENFESESQLAYNKFIIPLLKHLKLSEDKFIIVPGNHEVDRSKIIETYEIGLNDILKNNESFVNLFSKINENNAEKEIIENRLKAYIDRKIFNNQSALIESNFFYNIYKLKLNNINIGIVGLNSAWHSSQYGNDEKKLIIGENIVESATNKIQDCDIKITLAHHPFDMLADWDRKNVQRVVAQKTDLFCTGHLHDSNFEYIEPILGNLYISTCASLFSGRVRSGYSIISINLLEKELSLYLRKWYQNRQEFDQETEKCEDGVKSIKNFITSNTTKNDFIEILKIRHELQTSNEEENKDNILIPLEEIDKVKIENVFVEPLISDTSHFVKHAENKQYFSLKELLKIDNNLIFLGGKEFGKTMLLKYSVKSILSDERTFYNKIPVYIQFSKLRKNNPDSIITYNVLPSLDGNWTKSQVEKHLNQGDIILIIDDYDDHNDSDKEKRKDILLQFYNKYKKCKYIFSIDESISHKFKEESVKLRDTFNAKSYYLLPFNTAKIRELLKKWNSYHQVNIDKMLDQITYYFKQLKIPITPMTVTLFIGVLFRDIHQKNIKNEAYLIENYMETKLEKINKSESQSDFDFKDKESFLAHIAYCMAKENKYEWETNEFEKEKISYFNYLGEDLPKSSIFEEFFKCGILQEDNRNISFKFRSWFHFFLAKKMQKDKKIKDEILNGHDYLKYSIAIGYTSGLERNDEDLLVGIDRKTNKALEDIKKLVKNKFDPSTNKDEIDTLLSNISEQIEKDIISKNTDEEKDRYSDKRLLNYDPSEQSIEEEQEYDNIFNLVTLNSDIIRNTTELSKERKIKYLKNGVDYYTYLMWKTLEEFRISLERMNREELKNILYKDSSKVTDEDIDKIIKRANILITNIIPVSIIFYATDHLTTPKLKNVIEHLLSTTDSLTHKLFYSFLILKLNFKTGQKTFSNLIKTSKSSAMDFILFLGLRIYCMENKIDETQLTGITSLLDQIRNKHSVSGKKKFPIEKDTFASDLKKDVIRYNKDYNQDSNDKNDKN